MISWTTSVSDDDTLARYLIQLPLRRKKTKDFEVCVCELAYPRACPRHGRAPFAAEPRFAGGRPGHQACWRVTRSDLELVFRQRPQVVHSYQALTELCFLSLFLWNIRRSGRMLSDKGWRCQWPQSFHFTQGPLGVQSLTWGMRFTEESLVVHCNTAAMGPFTNSMCAMWGVSGITAIEKNTEHVQWWWVLSHTLSKTHTKTLIKLTETVTCTEGWVDNSI